MRSPPHLPPPRFIDVGDGALAVYAAGDPDGRPPVVFCHGFPETAFSWRRQISALAEAGRRALAPDQRGYGLSSRPEAVEAYDLEHLCDDLARILDAEGEERAVFCGHDWGGAVVWAMAQRRPDRVAGVIGLNTPFTPRAPVDPVQILRARFGDDMYMVRFQAQGEAEAVLERDVRRTLGFFYRRPPRDAAASGGLGERSLDSSASRFDLVSMIETYRPEADARETFLTPEEFEVFVAQFERSGFTGGVNWYRNITRNWAASEGLSDHVRQPALMITAELDPVLPPSAAAGMEAFVRDLEIHEIKGAGHWTQQEAPEAVNRLILDWLDRRFPLAKA